jgi:tetratricopeptide (TPR) repeat protein
MEMAAKLYLFTMSRWKALGLFLLVAWKGTWGQDCLDKPYARPVLNAEVVVRMEAQLEEAKKAYDRDSTQADVIIWYGRRLAYVGDYREAIRMYSYGFRLHPTDARFLRHRGHRWITLRCNGQAIIDLVKAAELVRGKPDQVEPDGMPNAQNIPTSTLQTNIWYHLGLALYLEKDYNRASEAWKSCLKLSDNPDMYMATAYWLYIALRRAGRDDEASALLATVGKGVKLIENEDYYTLLLLYKGMLKEQEVLEKLRPEAGSLSNATMGYGMGMYYLLNGSRPRAAELWKEVLGGSQWSSFGFIAAESEK